MIDVADVEDLIYWHEVRTCCFLLSQRSMSTQVLGFCPCLLRFTLRFKKFSAIVPVSFGPASNNQKPRILLARRRKILLLPSVAWHGAACDPSTSPDSYCSRLTRCPNVPDGDMIGLQLSGLRLQLGGGSATARGHPGARAARGPVDSWCRTLVSAAFRVARAHGASSRGEREYHCWPVWCTWWGILGHEVRFPEGLAKVC